jgi:hypothetical protein
VLHLSLEETKKIPPDLPKKRIPFSPDEKRPEAYLIAQIPLKMSDNILR